MMNRAFLLPWRYLGFRTISYTRLGFAPCNPDSRASAGTVEVLEEEFQVGSRIFKFQTGYLADLASGSVVLGIEQTKVLSTVCSKSEKVPSLLQVNYYAKEYAQGLIPKLYGRREILTRHELLCNNLIKRIIRPLVPSGLYKTVQILAKLLSADGKQDPAILAANASSAALMLSDVPWGGPIGVIRIGRIYRQILINPTMDELSVSDLNLIYACTRDKTMLIDGQTPEISEKDLAAALRLAHSEAVKYLDPQIRLTAKAGKQKIEYIKLPVISETSLKVTDLAAKRIESIYTDLSYGKLERLQALACVEKDVKSKLEEQGDKELLSILPKAFAAVRKKVFRSRMKSDGFQVDGRHLVGAIGCRSHGLHGSAFFRRGDAQVTCTVKIGARGECQSSDSLFDPVKNRLCVLYNNNHAEGRFTENALLAVLPSQEVFPYTIVINSAAASIDNSTYMATVCGGSMALRDAEIPLRAHVAAVSIYLVTDVDPLSGETKAYHIITDLGLEDHFRDSDMIFKIAGTRTGVTAIELGLLVAGIPFELLLVCLDRARKAHFHIIGHMDP